MKKILRKAWKFLWITLLVLLVLVILAFISLKLPVTQRFIADKAEQFVEDKTNTAVNIGKLNINFPKNVSIENLFVEDRNKDTLLYAGKIGVFISLSDLMEQNITLTQVDLADIDARVLRKDSTFNFNHFITAFSDTTSQKEAEPDTAKGGSWQFRIQDISLKNISARYYDLDSGDSTNAFLGNFETSFNTFDLEKQQFYLDDILLENTRAQHAIHSQPAPEKEDTTSSTLPDVKFESINLKSIVASYRNHPSQQEFSADLSTLSLTPEEFDLPNKKIGLDELEMSNSSFSAFIFSKPDTATKQTEETSAQDFPLDIPWEVSLTDLDLSEIDLDYHNRAFPDTVTGFDANHLSVAGLDLGLDNFKLADSEVVARLNDLFLPTSTTRVSTWISTPEKCLQQIWFTGPLSLQIAFLIPRNRASTFQ